MQTLYINQSIKLLTKIFHLSLKTATLPPGWRGANTLRLLLKEVLRAIMGIIDLSEPYASTGKNS